MGRPPSNGGPSFRFNPNEVAEMEGILQAHNCLVPQREVLVALAEKFSNSAERSGRPPVQMKQVWNWFQNRRYALRAKSAKPPAKLNVSPMPQHDLAAPRNVSQATQHTPVPAANVRNVPQVPQPVTTPTVQTVGKNATDNSQMEFEAKSARDGAWYDVATFLSHRSLETSDPLTICRRQFRQPFYNGKGGKEVLVRFAGFGPEEDEWVNIRKHVRQRSLPCESSECVAVLPGDLILCFQEGKEQALYFDAHVLDAQRRRHDVRGCRCRFLVRYDHDQSEEIVPLRKVCRRPETDYRMLQLHADSADMKQNKTGPEPHNGNNVKAYQPKVDGPAETTPKPANAEMPADSGSHPVPVSHANISVPASVAPPAHTSEPLASATPSSPHSNVSVAPTLAPDPNSRVPGMTILPPVASNVDVAPTAAPIANSSDPGATIAAPVASSFPVAQSVDPVANSSVPGATIIAPTSSNVHATPAGAPIADSSVSIVSTTAPAVNTSVPIASTAVLAANTCVPGATVLDPVASNIHVAQATTPVANSRAPFVSTTTPPADASVPVSESPLPAANSSAPTVSTTTPAADAGVPTSETSAPAANSSAPTVSTTTPAADVSVPTSETSAPAANSSAPTVPTATPATDASVPISETPAPAPNSSAPIVPDMVPIANSSVQVAPAANSSAPASNAEAPFANSSVPIAMTTEALLVTNSSVPEVIMGTPVASNVPRVTESDILLEKVSESGSADNVDNFNAQSANLSTASGNYTSKVSEGEPGESMQLG